ncbi:hypothetical protein a10_04981 [Streptomyces acidiscabies]|nr:hypothetical protein a10_04981 [Streptomyces acidiscabies]
MVEDLDGLVVRGRGEEFRGRQEGLAGACGGAEAGRGVRLEQGGYDLPEGRGDALGGARGAVFGEVLDQGLGVRLLALQEVQRDQPYGEQVGREVRVGAQELLGGDVARGADDEVRVGEARLAQAHRDAEVGQAQARACRTRRLQEDVRRFDVAVDDALGVHGGEAGQQLVDQDADERRREGAVVAYQVDQGAARDQVHREEDLVVVGGPARRGEDVRVVDAQGLFADEPQQGVGVALLEDLGGDVPSAAVVPGAPDRADSAAADRVDEFVASGEDLTHAVYPCCVALLPLRSPLGGAVSRCAVVPLCGHSFLLRARASLRVSPGDFSGLCPAVVRVPRDLLLFALEEGGFPRGADRARPPNPLRRPGLRSVLVGLVVRHRVRRAARAVDPEELGEFRVGRGEGVRRVDDVAGGGDRAQQGLDLPDHALDGGST